MDRPGLLPDPEILLAEPRSDLLFVLARYEEASGESRPNRRANGEALRLPGVRQQLQGPTRREPLSWV